MIQNLRDLSIAYDCKRGVVTSLAVRGVERLTAPSQLFRICLRDEAGVAHTISSTQATECTETEDGAVFRGFTPDVSVRVHLGEAQGSAAFRISLTGVDASYFVEWVDFPVLTLPSLEKNNREGTGGQILIPYNEGVLVSDIDERDASGFGYAEPSYPARGRFYVFPNMMCSQMMAYLWQDAGLYIGAHDNRRGVKEFNFVKCESGVQLRVRLFTGADFGEDFCMDYPVILSAIEGRWEAAAECYRSWFEEKLPKKVKKSRDNDAIPTWYADSPLVVSYPVRGIHDMDEMKPNKLYPYTNALPMLDEIRTLTDSRLLVLLMHWEGTAPWAPPYVWPPYGGVENFGAFKDALHERGDLLGVYCSGFGYTLKSNLVDTYDKREEYERRGLEHAMCADVDGAVQKTCICDGQRSGYDICPASPLGREILREAYAPLLEQNLDYVQILDQNHGGGQYFCYGRDHGHAPAPGVWMTESMQDLLGEWNELGKSTLLGCESAAADAFIGNLLFSDNRYSINYEYGVSVPLYAYLYHEYVRNFMGNQVECHLDDKDERTFLWRLGYSYSIGDSMTLVLTEDGEILPRWGLHDFSNLPSKDKVLTFIRNLVSAYKGGAGKYLFNARMITAPKVACESVSFRHRLSDSVVELPAILSSLWEADDGSRALILVNPGEEPRTCTVEGVEVHVGALSAVVLEM